MKIGGLEVNGVCEEVLILPRLTGNIVIKAHAVVDLSEFEALVPVPTAPGIRTKDGFRPNTDDPTYQQLLSGYSSQRLSYLVIKSLEPSQIEWEEVKLSDPGTWGKWSVELEKAGISAIEVNRIMTCVLQANSLDEEKLKLAREVFLRGQGR